MRKKSVSIKIDANIYNSAAEVLKTRGTNIETWIMLQLRAFSNGGPTLLSLKDKMPFGKYAGAIIEDIVRGDLRYVTWMLAQDFATKYDSDVHGLASELAAQ